MRPKLSPLEKFGREEECDQSRIDAGLVASVIGEAERETERLRVRQGE